MSITQTLDYYYCTINLSHSPYSMDAHDANDWCSNDITDHGIWYKYKLFGDLGGIDTLPIIRHCSQHLPTTLSFFPKLRSYEDYGIIDSSFLPPGLGNGRPSVFGQCRYRHRACLG